jgi:hypothetical protein
MHAAWCEHATPCGDGDGGGGAVTSRTWVGCVGIEGAPLSRMQAKRSLMHAKGTATTPTSLIHLISVSMCHSRSHPRREAFERTA